MAKNKPLKKQSATLQDNKTQNRNVEKKRNVHSRLLKSADVPKTWGQRYVKTTCQMPINKYDKIGK